MNLKSSITITKLALALVAIALVTSLTSTPIFAHGGFDHVMGTVVKVANNVLTVKTTKGNVDVKLDDKTEITKNSAKAQVSDLTPGVRVVVDIPEGNKEMLAHSVKIGTTAAADTHK
jgi:hypothetical protein